MTETFQKPRPKKIRGFTLSHTTSDLIDELAARHGVSASRVVDIALGRYLNHLTTLTTEGAQDNE